VTAGAQAAIPRRQQARLRRRAELAEVAYRQVAAKGLEGLRIREVAGAAGINHATLLHYFPSKAALVDGVIDHLARQLAAPATPGGPAAPAGRTLQQRLGHELDDVGIRLQRTPEIFAVLTQLQLRSARDPAVRAGFQRLDRLWIGYLTALVSDGLRAGECRPGTDPDQAALLLAAIFRGIGLLALTGTPAQAGAVIRQAREALWYWLQP
jgi:AcrR family transcriptional regulator